MLQPWLDRIAVEVDWELTRNKGHKGLIVLAETEDSVNLRIAAWGHVVAVGDGWRDDLGCHVGSELKAGDLVCYDGRSGEWIEVDGNPISEKNRASGGRRLLMIREIDIWFVAPPAGA